MSEDRARHPRWDTPDAFYAVDERRGMSEEIRLPGVFYGEGWGESYELYWLAQTGEIAAIAAAGYHAEPAAFATDGGGDPDAVHVDHRPVELIGWCETRDKAAKTFAGWASHARQLKSLYWLRQTARARDSPCVPAGDVQPEHRDRAAANSGSLF